jgi:hypothetical protein
MIATAAAKAAANRATLANEVAMPSGNDYKEEERQGDHSHSGHQETVSQSSFPQHAKITRTGRLSFGWYSRQAQEPRPSAVCDAVFDMMATRHW